jgi:hypothetical protein
MLGELGGFKLIIAVIYLGTTLPTYVIKNLKYLSETFPSERIVFISDSKKSLTRIKKLGVESWLAPNSDTHWQELRGKMKHSMNFREGFWFKTLARIFVLDLFLQENPNESCLQIEADVFLFKNFPFEKFRDSNAEIEFPMESKQMGIASLLFLRNRDASKTLVEMTMEEINQNGYVTDMSLLGIVAKSNRINFSPLSTLPTSMISALNDPTELKLFCGELSNDLGVFDGITIGQYLLGIDPRNSRGWKILHRKQNSHGINPEKLNFIYENNDVLLIENHENRVQVYNLHNHAKDLRIFNAASRAKLLKNRTDSAKFGESREFILMVFLESLWQSFKRRVKFHGWSI